MDDEAKALTLRNPWGQGDESKLGTFSVTWAEFAKLFNRLYICLNTRKASTSAHTRCLSHMSPLVTTPGIWRGMTPACFLVLFRCLWRLRICWCRCHAHTACSGALNGRWRNGTAGGSSGYPTWSQNPQYALLLSYVAQGWFAPGLRRCASLTTGGDGGWCLVMVIDGDW